MRTFYTVALIMGMTTWAAAQRPATTTPTPTPRPTTIPRPTATPRPTPMPYTPSQPASLRPAGGSFTGKPAAGALTNQIGAGSLGTTMQSSPNASAPREMAPVAGSFVYGSAPVELIASDDRPTTRSTRSTRRAPRRSRR